MATRPSSADLYRRREPKGAAWVVHAQRRCLDPAKKAGRHGRDWSARARLLRLALLRWQHGHRRRTFRQRLEGSCVGLHAQRRCLDPARKSWSARERLEAPCKATPSRSPPTATRPSSAELSTTGSRELRGCSRAAAVSGPSKKAGRHGAIIGDGTGQGFSVSLSSDGNTAIVGGPARRLREGSCVGVHAQRRCLDPATTS